MKTRINMPRPASYLASLLVTAVVGVALYLLLHSQSLTDGALYLAAGLVAGHLAGILSTTAPDPAEATDTTEAVSLYVGNLAYKARNESVRKHFGRYGTVYSVRIMTDRNTNRPRGYAFVEMDSRGAQQAIQHLNDSDFLGRPLKVNTARQQTE